MDNAKRLSPIFRACVLLAIALWHTWASFALASGKSVRRVAEQLGHASPMLTLQTYAHAI